VSERGKTLLRRLLVVPPVAAALVLLAWQIGGRQAPEQTAPGESARTVRVIVAQPATFVPRALGYGYVQPGSVWEAVAEVGGKIVYRHPELERGRLLEAGTEILRIDPADYELAVVRIEANLESVAAQLAELAARQSNTESSLAIERRALALAQEDLARKRTLRAGGAASQSAVDQAESAVLTARQRVQELDNLLNLLPAERRVLQADLALNQAQLREAELNLERTVIRLPFDARIAEILVESTQFVSAGAKLAVADSIDVAEVSAQMAIDQVAPLVRAADELSALSAQELAALPRQWGLTAEVRLVSGELTAAWEARFDRLSDTVDPQTRTVGLIVAVDEPYRKAIPGRRPPLAKNMFVEVELRGPPQPDRIAVPRVALHRLADGRPAVYLAGADDRLAFRPVTPGPAQGDFVVIEQGLEGGERVVVSDLIPAIEGMLLAPAVDEALSARLLAQIGGAAALR